MHGIFIMITIINLRQKVRHDIARLLDCYSLSMRGKNPPLLRGAVVGIGLGLQDIYGIKNIIVHSVNNFLLPMINSVNVKNNNIIKIK